MTRVEKNGHEHRLACVKLRCVMADMWHDPVNISRGGWCRTNKETLNHCWTAGERRIFVISNLAKWSEIPEKMTLQRLEWWKHFRNVNIWLANRPLSQSWPKYKLRRAQPNEIGPILNFVYDLALYFVCKFHAVLTRSQLSFVCHGYHLTKQSWFS